MLVCSTHLQRHLPTLSSRAFRGGDVAQLVERRTGTPLTPVRFPGAARDFSPSQLSVQTLLRVSVHPRVQPQALTSERTLKIPWSMSEFGGLWKR